MEDNYIIIWGLGWKEVSLHDFNGNDFQVKIFNSVRLETVM